MHDALEGLDTAIAAPVKPIALIGHDLAATFASAWPWPFMPSIAGFSVRCSESARPETAVNLS
jgi:hypothetical protein